MVYEPLENLLDRAWRARAGSRLLRRTLLAAVVGILLLVLGPVLLGQLESSFDRSIAAKAPWSSVESGLALVEAHPLHFAEVRLSESHRSAHARRLIDLRRRMLDGEITADDERIVDLERQALRLHPEAVVVEPGGVRRLDALVAARDRVALESFLLGGGAQPETIDLTGEEVVRLATSIGGVGPAVLNAAGWEQLIARLAKIDLLATDGRGPVRVRASGNGELLRASLERLAALARERRVISDPSVADSIALDELAALSGDAARAGDREGIRAIDELLLRRYGTTWESQLGRAGDESGVPDFRTFLDAPPGQAWLLDAHRARGRLAFDRWIESLNRRLAPLIDAAERDSGIDDIPTGLVDAIAQIESARALIGTIGTDRDRWMLEGLPDGSDELLALFGRRQQVLDLALRTDSYTVSLVEAVRENFATPDRELSIGYRTGDGRSPDVSFGDLAAQQRKVLAAILEERMLELIGAENGAARNAFSALSLLQESGEDSQIAESVLRVAEELARSADPARHPALCENLRRFAGRTAKFERFESLLIRSLENSRAFGELIAPMLSCIDDVLLQRIIEEVDPERWSTLGEAALLQVFDAGVRIGMERGDVALQLGRALQEQAIKGTPLERINARERLGALLGRACRLGGDEVAATALVPTLTELRERYAKARSAADFGAGTPIGDVLELLRSLEAQGARSAPP